MLVTIADRYILGKGAFNNYVNMKRGVSQKSTLVHSGGGGPLNVHVDKNLAITESMYFILLCTIMGGKKEIKLH